jgi:hypothetical protein
MNISYTINSIDSFGTINFSFSYNGHDYTCGQNFGALSDQTTTDENGNTVIIKTAAELLNEYLQSYIQNFISTIPATVSDLIGQTQTFTLDSA